jgi:hypothetical protein
MLYPEIGMIASFSENPNTFIKKISWLTRYFHSNYLLTNNNHHKIDAGHDIQKNETFLGYGFCIRTYFCGSIFYPIGFVKKFLL